MKEYSWNVSSALYQIQNGEPGDKTTSASHYLLDQVYGPDMDAGNIRVIASTLVKYVTEHAGDNLTHIRDKVDSISRGLFGSRVP